MAIADLLRTLGGKVNTGISNVGNTFANMNAQPTGILTPEQQRALTERQQKANLLFALGDAFKGKDIGQNYLAREQNFMAMDAARQAKARQNEMSTSAEKIVLEQGGSQAQADLARNNPVLAANIINEQFENKFSTSAASVERFGVYDPKTNKLIGTVLKTDQPTINEVQNAGNIVGALRSPSVDSGSTRQYQVVTGPNNEFVRNVSADELNLNPLQPGEKLTNLPTGTEAASSSSTTDDLFDDTRNRFNAVNTIVAETSKLAQQFYDDPTSALATGSAAGFVDALVKNIDSATQLFTGKEDSKAYKMAQRNKSEEGTDFGQRIEEASISSGVAESRIRDLAYLFAAARGQEGRGLSDKDYENALRIVSGGVGAKGRIAVLEDVSTRLSEQFSRDLETDKSVYDDKLEYINKVNKLPPLEVFVNPYTLINPTATTGSGGTTSDEPKRIRVTLN
jgi:hypothetical protein